MFVVRSPGEVRRETVVSVAGEVAAEPCDAVGEDEGDAEAIQEPSGPGPSSAGRT